MPQYMNPKTAGIILITLGFIVSAVFLLIAAAIRPLTSLENVTFQIMSLAGGISGSYLLGRESAREAAIDIIKPHARSAFRRLISLYSSLSRLAVAIEASRPVNDEPLHSSVLDRLEAMVTEQIVTVDDALEDWRDLVPDEVEELRDKLEVRTSKQKLLVK